MMNRRARGHGRPAWIAKDDHNVPWPHPGELVALLAPASDAR